jgi:ATP/maltotriose-dependent transcriptional regulator MalT
LAELPEPLVVFIDASKNSGLFKDADLISYVEKLDKAIQAKQMNGQLDLDDQQISLTGREKQILELAAEGMSNQEISDKIFVSLGTVKWHLHNVYDKLGVKNRTQALKAVQEFQKVS